MIDFNKILKTRENRLKRSDWPFVDFVKKIERSDKLLNEIEKHIKSRNSIQEARKQYIISLVTAFEVYFKDMFLIVVEIKGIDPFINEIKFKLDLKQLKDFIEKEISIEEIIESNYNFQNINNINKAFSTALGCPFLRSLEEYSGEIPNHQWPRKLSTDYLKILTEFIKLRHDFVHDIDFKKSITLRKKERLLDVVTDFIMMVDYYFTEKLL